MDVIDGLSNATMEDMDMFREQENDTNGLYYIFAAPSAAKITHRFAEEASYSYCTYDAVNERGYCI
jgi:hypothetical protein